MPVVRPTRFELAINLKTVVPPGLLARAVTLIE
jgi:hypothetical protein